MPFLTMAFRPFFLMTALTAIWVPMYLVTVVINSYTYSDKLIDVLVWHGHELLFGLTSSLFAGFFLTASTHWTGKKTITGTPLLFFLLLWIGTRLLMWWQPSPLLIITTAPLFLIILIAKMLFVLKGNKNFTIVNGLLILLLAGQLSYLYGNLWNYEQYSENGITLGLASVFLIITIFSGRLIPFFTNSHFKEQLINPSPKLEIASFNSAVMTFALSILLPDEYKSIKSLAFLLTGLIFSMRMTELFHKKILKEAMLSPFLFAHLWLPTFAFIRAYEIYIGSNQLGRASLHALMTGALGLFSVSVMSRAILGHTGRKIQATNFIKSIFILIFVGAMLRVFVPMVNHDVFNRFLHVSMGVWTLGYIFFVIKFAPMLFKTRADEDNQPNRL